MEQEKEREIIFIRHGLSEGNENPEAYQEGDPSVPLVDEGHRQLIRTGIGLDKYLKEREYKTSPLYVRGEFRRHIESTNALKMGVGDAYFPKDMKPHRDTRLNEISFGVLPHMIGKEGGDFEGLSLDYSKAVKEGNNFSAVPTHGESARFAHALMKSFLDGTVERDFNDGHDCIVCVTSGRPAQVGVMNLMHIPMSALEDGSLKNPNNGDMISVRGSKGNYIAEKIWDGPTATRVRENIMDDITPERDYETPDHIKDEKEFQHLTISDHENKYEL